MKTPHNFTLLSLRFAPALPLRGTSLREDGLHEAEAEHHTKLNRDCKILTSTNNPYTS